jgi:hypothetical protein
MDGVPVASVTGREVAHRGDEGEGEAEFCGIESAAEDFVSNGREPGKFGEFLPELIARSHELFFVGMHGAEDEKGYGEMDELLLVGGEEVTRVPVDAADVERKSHDDGIVAFEALHLFDREGVYREPLPEEVIGDSVGDFFG